MTESRSFTIDIILLVPENSICYIQAPDIENTRMVELMKPSAYDYYQQIILTKKHKQELIYLITKDTVVEYFHRMEIRFNNSLLIEGYDGMQYALFSKNFELPEIFLNKYKEMIMVANDW